MAIYRTVQLSFWTDNKVVDDFTPEDKYFYLYLFTNPQTNLCGCYEVSLTTMANQTGYNKETVIRLIERFETVHNVLKYSKETKEILLLNWHRYNWQGGKQIVCLKKEIFNIKDATLRGYIADIFIKKFGDDEDLKPLISPLQAYCLQATVTVTDTVNNTVINNIKDNKYKDTISNIINYLNNKLGTKYKANSKVAVKHITARLNEGYLEEDFYVVIDKKYDSWHSDTKMAQYLTPETLFGTKFEKYYNEPAAVKKTELDGWAEVLNGSTDWS